MSRLPALTILSLLCCSAHGGECAALIDQMENMGELKKILHCLDQKAANAAVPQPFQHGATKARQMAGGYLFEVESCTHRPGSYTCSVVITNKNKTVYAPSYREFGIYVADSNFYDEYGNQYDVANGKMGNTQVEAQGPSNRKNFKDGYLEKYMPLGIPMRLTLSFAQSGDIASTVMALNIKFSYRDGKDLAEKFVTLESIGIENGG